MVEEPELGDEELLGEATLAKLSPKRSITIESDEDVDAIIEQVAIVETEETAEIVEVEDSVESDETADLDKPAEE
jgi:hypothetical protein